MSQTFDGIYQAFIQSDVPFYQFDTFKFNLTFRFTWADIKYVEKMVSISSILMVNMNTMNHIWKAPTITDVKSDTFTGPKL